MLLLLRDSSSQLIRDSTGQVDRSLGSNQLNSMLASLYSTAYALSQSPWVVAELVHQYAPSHCHIERFSCWVDLH